MAAVRAARTRRTQAERSAETRKALLDATTRLLHRGGYSGTTTEAIAAEAGVSRGALQHHFPTRAQLMAEVIGVVYEEEHALYQEMLASNARGSRRSDWPEMLWEVLSRPAGMAVLEVLQASRSDPELAALVAPVQAAVEQRSILWTGQSFPKATLAEIRFCVWAVRGLSIAQVLADDPAQIRESIAVFTRLVRAMETDDDGA